MAGTFVSYRRDDSSGWTGRLYEYLVREWGADEVFMDIDAIAPGEDFRKAITVIPVLVGGAAMPVAPELPEPLQEVAYRNAAVIDDRRFPGDVQRLINAVSQAREAASLRAAPDSDSVPGPGSSTPRRFLSRPQAAVLSGRPVWLAVAGIAIVLVCGVLVSRSWPHELSGIRIAAASLLVGVGAWGLFSKSWNLVLAAGVVGLAGVILWILRLFDQGYTTQDVFSLARDGVSNLLTLAGAVMVVVAAVLGRKASEQRS